MSSSASKNIGRKSNNQIKIKNRLKDLFFFLVFSTRKNCAKLIDEVKL